MISLGWNRPLLHAAADWLLARENVEAAPDLSRVLVVVRGRRAGRRLLELLAGRCAEAGSILVPPEIVTPSSLVRRLTRSGEGEHETAKPLACALAWAEAIREADPEEQEKLFRRPDGDETAPGLGSLVVLGRHLHQVWTDLGGAGLGFRDVKKILAERFPHIADLEIPRWEVLENLHEKASRILSGHGLIDPTDFLLRKARGGDLAPERQVVLVGVAEMPKIVAEFLRRLPQLPTALVFAPPDEEAGFDDLGLLVSGHWQNRDLPLAPGQIHAVERDRDQALRAARIVQAWRDEGIPPGQVTIAVPDTKALPRLREALETERFEVRSAQGRPTSDAPSFQLLRAVAAYLDHAPDEPPRYEAVAALVRVPDLPGLSPAAWPALDHFAGEHLPARFDPSSVIERSERVHQIDSSLRRIIDLADAELAPAAMAAWTLEFLQRVYGERQEQTNSPEGRLAVQGLELLRDLFADTRQGRLPWPRLVRPADFLSVILRFLGEEPVPEPSDSDAVQVVGWLELVEDDAPAVIVASFHEGAVPESVSSDPFLPGALREALGLADNAFRFARDAYALAAVAGSRAEGRGGLALLAPRFDPGDDPTRPSRLLLAGLEGDVLARRVWHLAGRRPPEPQLQLEGGSGFTAAPVELRPVLESLNVTAFRDYIESPRKFYFRRVLRLQAEDDAATELQGADVGTLVHAVLAAFGTDSVLRETADEERIRGFVFPQFEQLVRDRFGRWAQPAVEIQLEEVRKRLAAFARVQAGLRRDGWTIRYVEGAAKLECEFAAETPPGRLRLTGKIDRIDYHAAEKRWRIFDYKTSAKTRDPLPEHRKRNGEWRDLQLPLYLQLAAPYARAEWDVALTPENCELAYFLLPEEENDARLSAPFPAEMIGEAWREAAALASKILRHEFEPNPPLNPERNDPALLALCGQVGLGN
jgi:ATP-dependent helicase/nuclease subunit B